MLPENILPVVISLKIKNCEGHDYIPQWILLDWIDFLKNPLFTLFNKIYIQKIILEQWLISKVIPIHKKDTFLENCFNQTLEMKQMLSI